VGGAGYGGGQGVIRVYTRGDGGLAEQLGDDIIGNPGEKIGMVNRIYGISNPLRLFVGTATGLVRIFDYNMATLKWEEGSSVATDFNSVSAVSSSGAGESFVVGGNNHVSIFDEEVPNIFQS